MKTLAQAGRLLLGPVTLSIGCLLCIQSAHAVGITGLGDIAHNSEYLFGFSGGTPNTLTLNGSTVLSTGTGQFTSGVNNQGWWSATAGNGDGNDNYFVGDTSSDGSTLLNNFFTFDISGLSGTVSSAVFNVRRYQGGSDLGATAHTYIIYDVSTDAATLNANVGTSAAIFADLGSGTSYGSYVISVAGSFSEILNLTLNASALSDLNAAIANGDDYFSIGGTLYPSSAPVPDSTSTGALMGLSLAALCLWSRCRSRSIEA